MVAPILPHLTDSVEHLDGLLGQIAAAGATGVSVFGLHLRGSTRGWFMSWLARSHPELLGHYRELYRRGAYLPPSYRETLRQRAAPLIAKYRLACDHRPSQPAPKAAEPQAVQATLF
jgi:DNA repair photolyase